MTKLWYPGSKFPNGWEINNIIDSGGMGTVYIVEHPQYEEPLAAKTFKQEFFSKPHFIQRFLNEAEMWVQLGKHNHIVQAKFVETIEGKPYVFLEYIPGPNLRKLLWEKLDLQQALAFAIQFCDGMNYVHEKELEGGAKGLVHRDIKPENILISVGDILKITDFGLAKSLSGDNDIDMGECDPEDRAGIVKTNAGTIIGTLPYMSPEHFKDPEFIDKLSDIYSFGVVLFEMLTGQRPFQGNSLHHQHLNVNPQPPRSLNPNIPKELETLVMSCLEKKSHLRPANFAGLREKLQEVYGTLTGRPFRTEEIFEEDELEKFHRLADSYYNLGKPQKAINLSNRALSLEPESEAILNIKGRACCALGNYKEALQCFEKVLNLNPGSRSAWNNSAMAYLGLENFEQAIYCCDRRIQIAPDAWEAYHNKGVILDTTNRREEALHCFDRVLGINPRHVNSWASKGNVLQKLERYDEALACQREALSINPRDANALNNMVVIYLKLNRPDEALKWIDRLLEVDPRYPSYWLNKAIILLNMKQYDTAVETIEEGLTISPMRVRMMECKLHILKEIADVRPTPEYLRRVYDCVDELLALEPDNKIAKALKSAIDMTASGDWPFPGKQSDEEMSKSLNAQGETLLNMMGDLKGAVECFQKAIELNPGLMDAYNNMGVALEMQNHIEEAIEYYNKANELSPNFFMPWYNKGNCYKSLHDFEEALECYNQAIDLNPGFVGNWINKGATLMGLERIDEALECYKKALELDPDNPIAHNGKAYCEKFL